MNLARLAIQNSRITVIAIFGLIALGISTFLSYPSAEDPTIEIRTASIEASFPGMSAKRIEELIAIPIETAMREIAEIDEIKSTSKTGSVKVTVDIHEEIDDLEPVFQDIRNKILDLAPRLPEGTQGPSVNDEEGLTAIATVALWSDGFSMAEMLVVAEDVRDLIYTLDGVRKVQILGSQQERIFLEFDPVRLAGLGVPPEVVFGALAQQNIIEPGGNISAGGRVVTLEPSGNFDSLAEIAGTVFRIPETGQVLRLNEVVEVRRAYADPPVFPSFFNDRPAIILSVSTVEGTNNIAFGADLTRLLDEAEQELPIGYVLDYATFQPDLIETAVQSAVSNVYQTLAIVLAVVMVFLGLRTGLIVGSFVPLTMLLGIVIMSFAGVELQRMSIAAMIIALGLLVDNGIVVAEDIRVRLERGADRVKAASDAVAGLAIPLLTSSLTTVFAFLPMLLTPGGAGDYVRSLAQVVAILLLGSWFLSMTVTPAMCAWFLKFAPSDGPETPASYDSLVYRVYRRVLETMLNARLLVIALTVAAFFGSIQLLGTVKTEFFPLGDRNQILVYLDFEAGSDQRETERELRKLTAWLSDRENNPEIVSNVAYVGYGGPRFFLAISPVDPDPHRAFVLINTASVEDVGPVRDRVNAFIDSTLPGANGDAKRMWFGATEPGIVEIELVGPRAEALTSGADHIVAALHAIPGTVGIKQDWENPLLVLAVEIDQTRARRAGVTSSDVASSLNTVFTGAQISSYREGDRVIPIVLRGDANMRFSIASLSKAQIYSQQTGTFVSLDQVATVLPEWRPSRIKRLDQQRTLTIEARHSVLTAPQLFSELGPALDVLDLPAGHKWQVGGEIKDQAEANENLFGLLPIAFAGIVILLVGQFNSFRKGGIIIATIPLVMIGGTLGLIVMGAPYGFMVLLGFFSLAGILINNGIVLIDRMEIEAAAGHTPREAVIQACLARLRPILMTTLTTVLGLVPLILFGGALFYGMASVIAFGLIVGTVFTLGFVPVLYTVLMRTPMQRET
ncbi:MAG: efflux RND transporter permease subunit [Pseudomonadota bacterium]